MEKTMDTPTDLKPQARPRARKKQPPVMDLNLPEKLFILSVEDDQGQVTASIKKTLRFGLAGALLADLALANKIHLEDERLALTDPTPTGDNLFDEVLAAIAAGGKARKLSRWVNTLGDKQIVKQVAERLAGRNVIRIEKKRYSWIIPYELYPQVNASTKFWVKQHLRGVVLAEEKAAAADIALLSLLNACRLLRLVFTRDERKAASKKVDQLVEGESFGEAVLELLADIDAVAAAASSAAGNSG
jgi:hypothetical protein